MAGAHIRKVSGKVIKAKPLADLLKAHKITPMLVGSGRGSRMLITQEEADQLTQAFKPIVGKAVLQPSVDLAPLLKRLDDVEQLVLNIAFELDKLAKGQSVTETASNVRQLLPKVRLPKFLLVGANATQQRAIEAHFDGRFDFIHVNADAAKSKGITGWPRAALVVVMVDFISHSAIGNIKRQGYESCLEVHGNQSAVIEAASSWLNKHAA